MIHLDFSYNAIGLLKLTEFTEALKRCTALVRLSLSNNQICGEDLGRIAGGLKLAVALKECNALTVTLTELDLSNTDSVMPVGDEGAGMVAEVQRDHNEIGANGVPNLAPAPRGCKGLVHLDLSGSSIGHEGAERLVHVLGECKALAYLDLGDNAIGGEPDSGSGDGGSGAGGEQGAGRY
eukprot:1529856-Rhodomonas_salina.1